MNRGSHPRKERAFARPHPDTCDVAVSATPTSARSLFARLDDSDEEAAKVLANVGLRVNLCDESAWAAGRLATPLLGHTTLSITVGECDDEVATIRNRRTSRKRLRTLPQLDTPDALAAGVSGANAVALNTMLLTMAPSRFHCLGEESDEAAPPPLTPPCVRRSTPVTDPTNLTDPKEKPIRTAAKKKARIDADADAAGPPGVVRSVHIRGPIVMSETHVRAPVCRTLLSAASCIMGERARPAAASGVHVRHPKHV
jgi:hypothetical protein